MWSSPAWLTWVALRWNQVRAPWPSIRPKMPVPGSEVPSRVTQARPARPVGRPGWRGVQPGSAAVWRFSCCGQCADEAGLILTGVELAGLRVARHEDRVWLHSASTAGDRCG